MNIRNLTDEQLEKEIIKHVSDNSLGEHYNVLAKFLRQCVEDSMPTEDQIYVMLDDIGKNMSVTFDMIQSDKDELVDAILKLMEGP